MTLEYENAIAKYYSKMKIIRAPLLCWDLFNHSINEAVNFNKIQHDWTSKESFFTAVIQSKNTVLITDINYNIVFASNNMIEMNGYRPDEVLSKNPKMFQGDLTCDSARKNIKYATANHLPFKEVIVNYKKDGSTYLCEICGYPKFDKQGNLVHYIAFEKLAA
jgi:PAS domain S-box-containing protein